ncbi:MAG: DUF5131 family protein [Chthoniobacteraceae bacterium]|nr:DUF5131 family protein [Chthoniobacteraceae bacterium]
MAKYSSVEWADHTFNPWIGCTKVSPGCTQCYAEAEGMRQGGAAWGRGKPRVRSSKAAWSLPPRWNQEAMEGRRRRRVFCAGLSDVFDAEADPAWRADLWKLIRRTPFLDWLLLTKRPENIAAMLPGDWGGGWANVCLMTSVEDQERTARIPVLLEVPARFRGVAVEPLLGPVKVAAKWLKQLDWVVAGPETGGQARPTNAAWVRALQKQCATARVRFFFTKRGSGMDLDGRVSQRSPFGRSIPEREIVPPLTPEERHRLRCCEKTIRAGMGTFVAVGTALMEIRNARLYRQSYPSFEAYVHAVLALTRPRAYQLIDSAQVMRDLSAIVDIPALPQNEGQARELCRWKTPQERAEKWRRVLTAAGDGPVTAKFIRRTLAPDSTGDADSAEETARRVAACLARLRHLVTEYPAEAKALKWISRFEEILAEPAEAPAPKAMPELWLPGFGG